MQVVRLSVIMSFSQLWRYFLDEEPLDEVAEFEHVEFHVEGLDELAVHGSIEDLHSRKGEGQLPLFGLEMFEQVVDGVFRGRGQIIHCEQWLVAHARERRDDCVDEERNATGCFDQSIL